MDSLTEGASASDATLYDAGREREKEEGEKERKGVGDYETMSSVTGLTLVEQPNTLGGPRLPLPLGMYW